MDYDDIKNIRKTLPQSLTGSLTIALGAALSGALDVRGFHHISIQLEATWTEADIAIHASHSLTGTYALVRDRNDAPEIFDGVEANRFFMGPDVLKGLGFIKLASVSKADPTTAVNQAAARSISYTIEA